MIFSGGRIVKLLPVWYFQQNTSHRSAFHLNEKPKAIGSTGKTLIVLYETGLKMWTIAIGDIHGQAEKLVSLLKLIKLWTLTHGDEAPCQLVFLGDYIDRGPDSQSVLDIVRGLQNEGAICLRGNHEELMIRANRSELDHQNFLLNGGMETLSSLGSLSARDDAKEWMTSLPFCYEDCLHYFVHAGVRPGVALRDQRANDQIWIREPFLRHELPFEKYIVHGHTPVSRSSVGDSLPDVRSNRCNVDTGAGWDGPLAAAVFDGANSLPLYLLSTGHGILLIHSIRS